MQSCSTAKWGEHRLCNRLDHFSHCLLGILVPRGAEDPAEALVGICGCHPDNWTILRVADVPLLSRSTDRGTDQRDNSRDTLVGPNWCLGGGQRVLARHGLRRSSAGDRLVMRIAVHTILPGFRGQRTTFSTRCAGDFFFLRISVYLERSGRPARLIRELLGDQPSAG